MKKVKTLSFTLAIILLLAGYLLAESDPGKSKLQTICPIMAGEIDREIYADYQGKRVYFCCKGCIAEFWKDPAKYVKKIEDEGVTLEEAPKAGNKDKTSHATGEGGEQSKARDGCGCCS